MNHVINGQHTRSVRKIWQEIRIKIGWVKYIETECFISKFSNGMATVDVGSQPVEAFQDIFKSSVLKMVQIFQIRIHGQDNGQTDFKVLLFPHPLDNIKKVARYASIFFHAKHLVIIQDFDGSLHSRELTGHAI